jgi:FG-GAP-like repeat/FG-GAP repeat
MRIRSVVLACLGAAVLAVVANPGCVFYLNPLCTDQIRNGDETDIDCGGGACGPCAIGDSCRSDGDCEDSTCPGGTCTPLPCVNGVRDNGETDVDCGGGTCRPCAGGRTCVAATDCFNQMCAGTCFELATVSFGDAVSYASGNKAYALFADDLDGDGSIDLAAANELDSTISVFLNNGSGAFQRQATPFPTGDYPTGGTIADFNRDGDLDVVTADYHGNSVTILLGGGNGTLGTRTSYPTVDDGETSNLAVGDINGDGNLDVVATNPLGHSVSQFLGNGDGTLQPAVDIPVGVTGAGEPFSAVIGDFDGVNGGDLAIADNRSASLIVRLRNADGSYQPEIAYSLAAAPSFIVIGHDVNRDGKLDLVSANRGSSSISVLLGRGDGTFRKATTASTGPGTGPYSLAIADFNLDGVPDVVTANYQSDTASVLIGVGDGTFELAINAGTTGEVSYGAAAGDFNGDGKPDFAIANAVSNDVTIKLNTSN